MVYSDRKLKIYNVKLRLRGLNTLMKAVITVIGHDKVGIIAKISGILADAGVNILDISQTIMQDMFTMIMLVSIEQASDSFSELSKKLDAAGELLGLSVRIQHEDIFNSMHRI